MKLKIYSDERYLLKQDGVLPHPMLYPFWSHFIEETSYPWTKKYDHYIKIAKDLFEMTSLEEADFAVMPDDWRTVTGEVWYSKVNQEAKKLYFQFAEQMKQAGKPLVVFFGSDLSDQNIHLNNAYIFRHSYYKSKQKKCNFVWPVFCEDLIDQYLGGELSIREKSEKPIVGFCGLVKPNSWKSQLKRLAYYGYMVLHGKLGYPPIQGHILRERTLNLLQKSPLIATNFIIRDSMVFLGKKDAKNLYNSRLEFVQNLIDSDYIVCCRGAGNYSNRLFETLCCGRIPVIVNTDCVLPYDFTLDWKDYCVWVEESELSQIDEKIAAFHQQLSLQDFRDLQQKCRQLWREWLSPEGFYSKFYLHFNPGL